MRTNNCQGFLVLVIAFAAVLSTAAGVKADHSRIFGSSAAEIDVWVDERYDVYPSFDEVVISMRPAYDCYVTMFVVDTEGFVHVVYPFSPRSNAFVSGGTTCSYSATELGLDVLGGSGIAYVFAVGSPHRFDYGRYGDSIWVGHFGYRIYGDPYVACREFYASLLPAYDNWDFVGVNCSRFYIREWARYPHYLCHAHHGVHVRVGSYCDTCSRIYDGYLRHVADPMGAIAPSEAACAHDASARLQPVSVGQREAVRRRARVARVHDRVGVEQRRENATVRTRVVSSSKTFNRSAREMDARRMTLAKKQPMSGKAGRKVSSIKKSAGKVQRSREASRESKNRASAEAH